MITIFVTGGIGSGKSTLMRFFEAKGAGVVYADKVGHENLHNAAMKDELRAAFGNKIFDSEGEIVRSELAACAFSSPQNTALLDSITQPRLYEGCLRHIGDLGKSHEVVVLEMAILDGRDDFYQKADKIIITNIILFYNLLTPQIEIHFQQQKGHSLIISYWKVSLLFFCYLISL